VHWLKTKWEWLVSVVIALISIGILAAKKRDSRENVNKGDKNITKKRDEKIIADQANIYESHIAKKSLAQKEFETKVEEIASAKKQRLQELENNPDELDRILEEKYKLKGE
jgi:hypothetical protein